MEERKHLRNLHLFTNSVKNWHWQNRTFLTKKKILIKKKIEGREGKEEKPIQPYTGKGTRRAPGRGSMGSAHFQACS